MKFTILYDKQPKKFLKKLDKHQIKRIFVKVDLLSENPIPHDAKSIINHKNVFRIRLGDIRVLYRLNYPKKRIVVIKIENREKAYD